MFKILNNIDELSKLAKMASSCGFFENLVCFFEPHIFLIRDLTCSHASHILIVKMEMENKEYCQDAEPQFVPQQIVEVSEIEKSDNEKLNEIKNSTLEVGVGMVIRIHGMYEQGIDIIRPKMKKAYDTGEMFDANINEILSWAIAGLPAAKQNIFVICERSRGQPSTPLLEQYRSERKHIRDDLLKKLKRMRQKIYGNPLLYKMSANVDDVESILSKITEERDSSGKKTRSKGKKNADTNIEDDMSALSLDSAFKDASAPQACACVPVVENPRFIYGSQAVAEDIVSFDGEELHSAVATEAFDDPSENPRTMGQFARHRHEFLRENPNDPNLYETMPRDVWFVLRWLLAYKDTGKRCIVWEPCCGNGAISNFFRNHGVEVVSTDLYFGENKVDFLTCEVPPCFDFIITNPPYQNKLAFITRVHEIVTSHGVKAALLLPHDSYTSPTCSQFLEVTQVGCVIPHPKFIHEGKMVSPLSTSWYFWGFDLPKDIFYIRTEGESDV
jgi:hypothetical protein